MGRFMHRTLYSPPWFRYLNARLSNSFVHETYDIKLCRRPQCVICDSFLSGILILSTLVQQ